MRNTKMSILLALVLGLVLGVVMMGLPQQIGSAQAGTSMGNDEALMATGQIMGNQDALFLYTHNEEGDPMLMTYFVKGNQGLHLLSARNMKFDLKLKDETFVRGNNQNVTTTSPSVEWIQKNLKKEKNKKKD